jgi:hypothetical protein
VVDLIDDIGLAKDWSVQELACSEDKRRQVGRRLIANMQFSGADESRMTRQNVREQ